MVHFNRTLESALIDWKDGFQRKPLLLRGARQVGKSSLIESFGEKYFDNVVVVNFELNKQYLTCFSTLDPADICNALRVVSQQTIIPGKTLLFLDEIQDCPSAIQALRYFKELMPELHVIGAGSLLEMILQQANFRMPVGRVGFLYLYPLSFKEFLAVVNPNALLHLEQVSIEKPLHPAIHQDCLKQLRHYFLLGGMPEVLVDYQQQHTFNNTAAIHASILATYESDFGHYAKIAELPYLRRCFSKIPLMIGQQIKYSKIDPDLRSRELKQALSALEAAAVFQRVYDTSGKGLPLEANINQKRFKMNFIDVGLVSRINQLDAPLLLNDDVMLLNKGALAEQFVGQELLTYAPSYEKAKLYFWARDQQGRAEVDYLTTVNHQIIPIEVKAGKLGRLRSMHQYLKTHDCPFGVRISQAPLSFENNILSVPLYMLSELHRVLRTL